MHHILPCHGSKNARIQRTCTNVLHLVLVGVHSFFLINPDEGSLPLASIPHQLEVSGYTSLNIKPIEFFFSMFVVEKRMAGWVLVVRVYVINSSDNMNMQNTRVELKV